MTWVEGVLLWDAMEKLTEKEPDELVEHADDILKSIHSIDVDRQIYQVKIKKKENFRYDIVPYNDWSL
ncbi:MULTISPECIES: hypothetical protein [Peribacillus]|uniref:hypothetical protein n=1 Tax=Peribacillus TaxID=2675229 RepID=UPI001911F14E|nr:MULTISPECIES: hypothetical protein [unclassified Peribacillus]MBK5442980.1 hypothetical protein [Peribacillus sp. TH24]WMX54537.1 hypothetical protein RE409_21080 [Peribacillus sp. R9-11]